MVGEWLNYLPTKQEIILLFCGEVVAVHMGDNNPNLASVICNRNKGFWAGKIRHNSCAPEQSFCETKEKP